MDPAVIEAPVATPTPAPAPQAAPVPAAAPTPPPGFLGGNAPPSPPAAPPAAPPAVPGAPMPSAPPAPSAVGTEALSRILGADYVNPETGELKEGWSEALAKKGFTRLANKGSLAKSEDDFLKSLDHALQFVGKKAGHLPPTDKSTPEEIAEYRMQIGAPKEAKEYAFKPSNLPEGAPWDDARAAKVEEILHRHHAPAGLAKEMADFYGEELALTRDAAKAHIEAAMDADKDASRKLLQDEWGISFDTRLENTVDYMKVILGDRMDSDPIIKAACYKAEFIKLFDSARRELRETLPGANGSMATSESPRQQMRKLMTDNPNWGNMPDVKSRIDQLAKLESEQAKRR